MTFTEAAIEVLRREGKPLHFRKLTENRHPREPARPRREDPRRDDGRPARRALPPATRGQTVIPVQQGTFALTEWGLDEDPAGLEGLIEPPPDEEPYRGRERHPIPSREIARGAGRGEAARPRRKEEEEQRGRRFPPPAEVAYELLAGAGRALSLAEIAAQGAERLLMPDAFVRDGASLRAALLEDNRRRDRPGRRRSSSWTPMPSCSSPSPSRESAPPPSRPRRVPKPPRRAYPSFAGPPSPPSAADCGSAMPPRSSTSRRACSRSRVPRGQGREARPRARDLHGAPEDGPHRPAPRDPDRAERRRRDRAAT